jgi:hypothetical protein
MENEEVVDERPSSESSSSSSSSSEETPQEPIDINAPEYKRYRHYNFLRRRNKPKRGEQKVYNFDPIEEGEEAVDYFDRCYEKYGVRPAPIGPVKKIQPNSKCPFCESGKKFKKCCGRKI